MTTTLKNTATLENASPMELGEDYISFEQMNVKNSTIKRLMDEGEEGFKKLSYHFYFHLQDSTKEMRVDRTKSNHQLFVSRLRDICEILYKDKLNPFNSFATFYRQSQPQAWPVHSDNIPPIFDYLSLTSKHHEVAIMLYSLIVTGVNKEVALSWLWSIDGIPWYKNFDVRLGITDSSARRDKRVVLVGLKTKGLRPKPVLKSISINSPLFKYLQFLDKTRQSNREFIFNFADAGEYFRAFLAAYPVINDDNDNCRLTSIETRRIRKSFIGYQTYSLLKGVKNAVELVTKLREALDHKSFDTTFSSYIMKSGMSRYVIDSAIVALTTEMLEKAMIFAGEIKEDCEKGESNETVFLCDCTDPTNPSHGLPIAERCTKYDLCLGCERSEVYSEHLPAICYRILQYERKMESEPEVFKITLEDRLQIARDTIEKFRDKHSRGIELVEEAYVIANDSMQNDSPLLPPIL